MQSSRELSDTVATVTTDNLEPCATAQQSVDKAESAVGRGNGSKESEAVAMREGALDNLALSESPPTALSETPAAVGEPSEAAPAQGEEPCEAESAEDSAKAGPEGKKVMLSLARRILHSITKLLPRRSGMSESISILSSLATWMPASRLSVARYSSRQIRCFITSEDAPFFSLALSRHV